MINRKEYQTLKSFTNRLTNLNNSSKIAFIEALLKTPARSGGGGYSKAEMLTIFANILPTNIHGKMPKNMDVRALGNWLAKRYNNTPSPDNKGLGLNSNNSNNNNNNNNNNNSNNGTEPVPSPPPPPQEPPAPPAPNKGKRKINNRQNGVGPERDAANMRQLSKRPHLEEMLKKAQKKVANKAQNVRQERNEGRKQLDRLEEYRKESYQLLEALNRLYSEGTTRQTYPFVGGTTSIDPFSRNQTNAFKQLNINALSRKYNSIYNSLTKLQIEIGSNFRINNYLRQTKNATNEQIEELKAMKTIKLNDQYKRKMNVLTAKLRVLQQLEANLMATTSSQITGSRTEQNIYDTASSSRKTNVNMEEPK